MFPGSVSAFSWPTSLITRFFLIRLHIPFSMVLDPLHWLQWLGKGYASASLSFFFNQRAQLSSDQIWPSALILTLSVHWIRIQTESHFFYRSLRRIYYASESYYFPSPLSKKNQFCIQPEGNFEGFLLLFFPFTLPFLFFFPLVPFFFPVGHSSPPPPP